MEVGTRAAGVRTVAAASANGVGASPGRGARGCGARGRARRAPPPAGVVVVAAPGAAAGTDWPLALRDAARGGGGRRAEHAFSFNSICEPALLRRERAVADRDAKHR